jgi:uncharacterized protein YcbK (DUF882 family)
MIESRHFREEEFQRCSPSCSLQDMNQDAVNFLDRMRDIAGIPVVLNSAYRSKAYELGKKRTGTGAHTLGRAFDIRCIDDGTRWKLIDAAIQVGCTRIGVAKTYVHVDFSPVHTQGVIWTYY